MLLLGAESVFLEVAIQNLKIKIYRTIILPVDFLWVLNLVADIEGALQVEGV